MNCCSIDAKTDALFNEFLRHDEALDSNVAQSRSLAVERWRRQFHPAVYLPRADSSPPQSVQSPPTAVADHRLRRLGATSGGRRRSRRGGDGVDSPTRRPSFRRPSPHDSIEEEVFLPPTPATATTATDDAEVPPISDNRRRYELHDVTNHAASAGLLSAFNDRRTAAIPTICVREEIETTDT